MQGILNIAHVALWTRDLDSAASFWRRYFGGQVGEPYHSKRRPGHVSRMVTLPGGNARIELMTGPWVAEPSVADQAGWDHVAVSLGSAEAVDELAARCGTDGKGEGDGNRRASDGSPKSHSS